MIKLPSDPGAAASTGSGLTRIETEFAAELMDRVFCAGLHLAALHSLVEAPEVKRRLVAAIDDLDVITRDIRTGTCTEPSGVGAPGVVVPSPPTIRGGGPGNGDPYHPRVFEAMLANCPDGIAFNRLRSGEFIEVSDSFCALTGYRRDDLLGRTPLELGLVRQNDTDSETIGLVSQRQSGIFTRRLPHRDGEVHAVEFSQTILDDNDLMLTIVRDVSERTRLEDELRFYAERDPLTGLLNRRSFWSELVRESALISRHGNSASVLLADVDNLKEVNDSFGHYTGDDLIVEVANVLRGRLRRSDSLTRLGGDEFAALLPHTSLEEGERLAEAVRACVQNIEIVRGPDKIGCTVSIGVAPLTANAAPVEVLEAADRAMYESKACGRNRVSLAGSRPARAHEPDAPDEVVHDVAVTRPGWAAIGGL